MTIQRLVTERLKLTHKKGKQTRADKHEKEGGDNQDSPCKQLLELAHDQGLALVISIALQNSQRKQSSKSNTPKTVTNYPKILQCENCLPWKWNDGRGRPREARLQLALRPSMTGFGSAQALLAESGSRNVT